MHFPKLPSFFPFLAISIALLSQILWIIFLQYPPTQEQIGLGITTPPKLWFIRTICFILLLTTTFLFSKALPKTTRPLFWLFVIISPALPVVWASYPIASLKIFLLAITIFLLARTKIPMLFATVATITTLLLINSFLLHQTPPILSLFSLSHSQTEVANRLDTEILTHPNVPISLSVKRLAYNKYFILTKNFFNSSLSFFDGETLFFQEIHPLGAKSLVLFYWPEIFLFIFSLRALATKQISTPKSPFVLTLWVSFLHFILTDDASYKRLLLLIWLVSAILALGAKFILNSKNLMYKRATFLILFLTFYGFITNFYDRQTRPLFWLDNRPIVYEKLFTLAKDQNYQNYQHIVLTDTIGSAASYCQYFLQDCRQFSFANFDLSTEKPQPQTLYLGFTGNFFGPNPGNKFPQNLNGSLQNKNLILLGQDRIRDNIANGYDQNLIAVTTKK